MGELSTVRNKISGKSYVSSVIYDIIGRVPVEKNWPEEKLLQYYEMDSYSSLLNKMETL